MRSFFIGEDQSTALCRRKLLFDPRSNRSEGSHIAGVCSCNTLANTRPVNGASTAVAPGTGQGFCSGPGSLRTHARVQLDDISGSQRTHSRCVIGDSNKAISCASSRRTRLCKENRSDVLGVCTRVACLRIPGSSESLIISKACRTIRRQPSTRRICQCKAFRHTRTHGVILVCGQRHGSQDTNDSHHDHQFDQGKTFLQGTLHKSLLGVG